MSYSEKIYPEIPSAPPDHLEPQDDGEYRLKKIDEVEKFLRQEIKIRDRLAKKFKRRATASTISDTSVITVITALEVASIVTLTSGIGLPISIVLASTGLLLGLGSTVIHKTQRIFESKVKKHDKIKTLSESKLDSISGIVSKAVEDSHISHQEYLLILKEIENYRKMKDEIRTKTKKATKAISAEQREEILKQGREEGKQAFLAKITGTLGTPPVSAT